MIFPQYYCFYYMFNQIHAALVRFFIVLILTAPNFSTLVYDTRSNGSFRLVTGTRAVVGGVVKILAIWLISTALQTSLCQSYWIVSVCLCLVLGLNMVSDIWLRTVDSFMFHILSFFCFSATFRGMLKLQCYVM